MTEQILAWHFVGDTLREMFPEGAPVSESHWNDGTDCTTIYGETTCTRIDIPAPRD